MICRRSVLAFTAALMLASAAHAQQPVLRAAPLRPKLAVQPAIVPAAEQRLLAAQRRLSPPAKTFLAREAARLAAAGPVTEAQARAAVTQPGAPDLSGMPIEDAVMLMFMIISEDAARDTRELLEEMDATRKRR